MSHVCLAEGLWIELTEGELEEMEDYVRPRLNVLEACRYETTRENELVQQFMKKRRAQLATHYSEAELLSHLYSNPWSS